MNRLVAALPGPDGPGTPGVVRPRGGLVVRSLPVGAADRMDGRQIDHIEAHLGGVGEALLGIAEAAVSARLGRAGAREELVPRSRAGPLRLHPDLQRRRVVRGAAAVRIRCDAVAELLRERQGHARCGGGVFREKTGLLLQPGSVRRGSPPSCLAYQLGSLQELAPHLVPRLVLLGQPLPPGTESVHPGLDGVLAATEPLHRELGLPPVLGCFPHGDLQPRLVAGLADPHDCRKPVVSLGEDPGRHGDRFTDHPFDREAPRVDPGLQFLDDDAGRGRRLPLGVAQFFSCPGAYLDGSGPPRLLPG